ncbi:hypothetical protein [Pseudomonas putida]|uniref:hypothetical protein n=1 Tax=Pseudomonas putida TaxID=303 RepID=UPI0013A6CCB1|nr:hypothetical protein [Pseudomonas putida]
MVVNDNAGYLDKRGVLESIASRLAPTGDWLKTQIPTVCLMMQSSGGHGVIGGGFYTG